MKPTTGALVSPFDYRDHIASSAVMPAATISLVLPPTLHTDMGSMLNQRHIPACVAHDVVYIMRRYFFKTTGKWIDFSPRFLDILAKRTDGQDILTGGTFPRLVLKLAAEVGCCTTATLPNDTTLPILEYRKDSTLTQAMMDEAAQYKIPGYINVATDPISTRNALYLYEALTALFIIGQEFWTPTWQPADIDPVKPPVLSLSGHQVAAIGWDSPTLNLGRNQWGVEWDNNGEFHYDPLKWQGFILEQWAIAEVPTDVSNFLKQLPAQKDFHYQWNRNCNRGDFNIEVAMVQVAYMIMGYMKPVSKDEFGHYGPRMAAATFAFQSTNGIPPAPDNIGPRTRSLLNKKFAL